MNKSMRVLLSRLQRFLGRPGSASPISKRRHQARFMPKVHDLEDRTVPSGSDLFGNATPLMGLFATDTGSNVGATAEVNEPMPLDSSGTLNTVWWNWTAPVSGSVEVSTWGSVLDTVVGVYTGSAVGALEQVDANDDFYDFQSRVVFDALAGETYSFSVDGYGEDQGDIVITVGARPANDNFAAATPFTGTTVTGWNLAATGEVGEPAPVLFSTPTNSVWWSWTAPVSGPAEVNTAGSDLDTGLVVYTGSAVNALTLIGQNDDYYGYQSRVAFNAVVGTTYYFAVDGDQFFTGPITLNLIAATPIPPENHTPVIASQSMGVAENSLVGTVVGTVAASDPDAGQSLSYSFDFNPYGAFAIDSGTGQISVVNSAALDYEATHSFTLTVRVTDNGSPVKSAAALVTVALGDVNETPIFALNGPYSVNELSSTGTTVGFALAADVDAGQTFTYVITGGNVDGAFAIDLHNGLITVANSMALDFETTPVFHLNVQATDSGSPALSAATVVSINILDMNESPSISAQGFMVGASAGVGTAVGTVLATDPDAGQQLTYSINAGNESGAFAINASTGQITVASTAGLGTASAFVLSVRVTDNGVPSISALGLVSINVTSANHAPTLDNTGVMSLTGINANNTANSGSLVSAILASAGGTRIQDVDAGALTGIAVTAANTTNGLWQFSTNGGSTWQSLGAVSNTAARLLAADAGTRVRFLPSPGYIGTVNPALTFRAWDLTTGSNGGIGDTSSNGGSTAFSTATETASIAVYGAQQQINNLSNSVQALLSNGTLSNGNANSLQSSLSTALAKANQGNTNATVNTLRAFITKVQSMMDAGTLSTSTGQSLINAANAAIQTVS